MPGRPTRTTMGVVGLVATALLATAGGITLAHPALAAVSYTATSPVYLRKGPATTYAVLGVLYPGQRVVATGAAADGWVPVSYEGSAAYVSARYVTVVTGGATPTASPTASSSPTPTSSPSASVRPTASPSATASPTATPTASPTPTPTTSTPAATMVATAAVNIRSGPSLTDRIVGTLAKGTTIEATGVSSGRFLQVSYQGALRWVSGLYLAATATPPTAPTVSFQARTTDQLALRATPSKTAASTLTIPAGTLIGLTGVHNTSYSQAIWKGKTGWVLTGYLTVTQNLVGPPVPELPKAAGQRYVNVADATVYDGSGAGAATVDTVPKATVLLITGVVADGRSQIIYAASLRWIATGSLSRTRPAENVTPNPGSLGSVSLDRTNAYVHDIVRAIRAEFPEIKTMYGWRSYSAYSSDHPGGRALDIMIPSWSKASGKALGDAIARYLQENRGKFHVRYLIWRQRSWNVERNVDYSAWRAMSDRGGATANHLDHVHVSVYPVK